MTCERRRDSELRDELPRFRRVPAHVLTRILGLPPVRSVEDAVLRRVTCGAALVDGAGMRLACGRERRRRRLGHAAVYGREVGLSLFPGDGRSGRQAVAVLARLR